MQHFWLLQNPNVIYHIPVKPSNHFVECVSGNTVERLLQSESPIPKQDLQYANSLLYFGGR
jgi:hypothetical protein